MTTTKPASYVCALCGQRKEGNPGWRLHPEIILCWRCASKTEGALLDAAKRVLEEYRGRRRP